MDVKSAVGLGAGAVLGLGGGYALSRAIERSPEEEARDKALTQQQLLDKNEHSTKVLGALMVGLPVATGASLLGVKGFDALAARASGIPKLLASGAGSALALTGAVAGLGSLALLGGWGWVGLVAAGNERDDILRGENPYVGDD